MLWHEGEKLADSLNLTRIEIRHLSIAPLTVVPSLSVQEPDIVLPKLRLQNSHR
jgi:hypothetical protein